MREGWEIKKINEVYDVRDGTHDSPQYLQDGYPLITSKNLKNGLINYKKIKYISEKDFININKRSKVDKDDILFAMIGTIGNPTLVLEEPYFAIKNVALFKPLENQYSKFLKYYLESDFVIKKMIFDAKGTTQKFVGLGYLRNFPVPIPPTKEQKQIVAIIDKTFTAIDQAMANTEKNIQNAKDLFQSKLNTIFSQTGKGWEVKTLGELGKVSMCKRILKKQTSPSGDIPFYKIGTFGKKPNAFIDSDIYQAYKSKYSYPKIGDILISASGTIGRRVIFDGKPAYFQDSNIVWIDNNEDIVLNEYLYHFYEVCNWNPSKGATISRLYNADLRKIKISYPKIAEQRKLIKKMLSLEIQTHDAQCHYQCKFDSLSELKKSILQKAFAGELTRKVGLP